MNDLTRRGLLGAGAVGALAVAAAAETPVSPVVTLPLWPGEPPGGLTAPLTTKIEKRDAATTFYTKIATPFLMIYPAVKPNGSALVLAQGGGYVLIASSTAVPAAFTTRGFTVFELIYRLPGEGWKAGPEAPKQDVQRAMRLARKLAPQYGADPARIGVMGYSAGGHIAGMAATTFGQQSYAPVDDTDALSARPDFAVLSCSGLTLLEPHAHGGVRRQMVGDNPDPARAAAYSCEKLVTSATPPTFLVHATDDDVVPVENSIMMAAALQSAGVPTEVHLYAEAGHGTGPDLPADLPASHWPEAMMRWHARLTAKRTLGAK